VLERAKAERCDLVVFPKLTVTTFFPRWFMTDQVEIDSWFERIEDGHPMFGGSMVRSWLRQRPRTTRLSLLIAISTNPSLANRCSISNAPGG